MKIAILASRYPYPLEKGDKLRLFHHLRLLSAAHELHLYCITDELPSAPDLATLRPYCQTIQYYHLPPGKRMLSVLQGLLSGLPIHVAYFYNAGIHRELRQAIEQLQPDLIYCQLVRMMPYTTGLKGLRWIDLMDAFSFNIRNRLGQAGAVERLWLRPEARRLQKMETRAVDIFDQVSIISPRDKAAITTHQKDKISVLPNGVDTAFFHPGRSVAQAYDIAFAGNLGYEPNVAAVSYLYRIWQKDLKHLKVRIAGARPAKELLVLDQPGFRVEGWVADIREVYWSARIFAAPLFTGSGQQNKILEAMACGTPVITTTLVNESIMATPGRELLIADNADEFTQQIKKLITQPDLQHEMATAAGKFVASTFSWDRMAGIMEEMLRKK